MGQMCAENAQVADKLYSFVNQVESFLFVRFMGAALSERNSAHSIEEMYRHPLCGFSPCCMYQSVLFNTVRAYLSFVAGTFQ